MEEAVALQVFALIVTVFLREKMSICNPIDKTYRSERAKHVCSLLSRTAFGN